MKRFDNLLLNIFFSGYFDVGDPNIIIKQFLIEKYRNELSDNIKRVLIQKCEDILPFMPLVVEHLKDVSCIDTFFGKTQTMVICGQTSIIIRNESIVILSFPKTQDTIQIKDTIGVSRIIHKINENMGTLVDETIMVKYDDIYVKTWKVDS